MMRLFPAHCEITAILLLAVLLSPLFPHHTAAVSLRTARFSIEYDGVSNRYAETVLETAQQSLPAISRALGREPSERIIIVLTPTDARFRELTAGKLPDWSAAAAMPDHRIVFSPLAGQKMNMERILAHELVHVLINDAARENSVPRWFHEGCAELFSGDWGLRNELYMAWKAVRGDCMTFADIEDVFSRGEMNAGLAYDQSMLAVRYLVREHGRRTLSIILAKMSAGADFPSAFFDTTGQLPTKFEDEYLAFLRRQYGPGSLITLVPSTWTLMMMLFITVYIMKRRRTKQKLAEWEREEVTGETMENTVAEGSMRRTNTIIPFDRGTSSPREKNDP